MFDQSFTPKNLARVYHSENKKGVNIAGMFFPEILLEYEKINRTRKLIRKVYSNRRIYSRPFFEKRLANLYELRRTYKKTKNEAIEEKLEKISNEINSKSFSFSIEKLPHKKNDKDVFVTKGTAESYFAEKQIQKNIKYTYSVKQADRDLIVPQLRSVLEDNFPKFIIKTDIKSFYESIDRDLLTKKLNKNPILSLTTRKLITRLLREYESISGEKKGIPRGIGISAYLSELYLKEFDEKVRNIDNLIYYSRYVDDIVIVIAPDHKESVESCFEKIKEYVKSDNLELKDDKSTHFDFPEKNEKIDFDYLGYQFYKHGGSFYLSISKNKREKYQNRILLTIKQYIKNSKRQPNRSKKELFLRLRFLTGNTSLSNNKGNAVVGIYNSNKWVTDTKFLKSLDSFLSGKANLIKDPSVKEKVKNFSFSRGYRERTFSNFTTKQFQKIVRPWKA